MRRRFSLCIPVSLCWVSNESWKWNPGTGVKGDLDPFKDFPVCPAKEAADCKRVVCGGGWRRFSSGHGVAIAPTVQSHQQAVPQDLLAWVFWKFQHVDTVEEVKAPWPTQQGNSSLPTQLQLYSSPVCLVWNFLRKKGFYVLFPVFIIFICNFSLSENDSRTVSNYQVLEVGNRLEVYGTAAIVNFCKPLPPIR